MNRDLVGSLGFVLAPAAVALYWVDLHQNVPLMALVFFIVMPLLRVLWPLDQDREVDPEGLPRALIACLQWLPHVFALLWIGSALYLPFWADFERMTVVQEINLWVATWIISSLSLASCHELVHRKNFHRVVGRILGATSSLSWFAEEHLAHHLRSGRGRDGDCAEVDEGLYHYVWRTSIEGFRMGWEYEIANQMRTGRSPWSNYIVWTGLFSLLLLALWVWTNGLAGAVFFLLMSLAVSLSLRAITYIQHWGLREVSMSTGGHGLAWSSSCMIQGWLLFGLPYHDHHHQQPSKPYWQLRVAPSELTLPVTYPLCFLLCLVPPLYRTVMGPRLGEWVSYMRSGEGERPAEFCVIPRR
jgi:alkane 1-monooxygenase